MASNRMFNDSPRCPVPIVHRRHDCLVSNQPLTSASTSFPPASPGALQRHTAHAAGPPCGSPVVHGRTVLSHPGPKGPVRGTRLPTTAVEETLMPSPEQIPLNATRPTLPCTSMHPQAFSSAAQSHGYCCPGCTPTSRQRHASPPMSSQRGALLCRACRAHAYAVSKLCRWIERDPSLLISPLTLYSIAAPLGMPEDDTKSILSDQEMHRSSGLAGQFLSLLHRWKRSYVDEGFVDASSYLGHALLVAKEAKLAKIFIGLCEEFYSADEVGEGPTINIHMDSG